MPVSACVWTRRAHAAAALCGITGVLAYDQAPAEVALASPPELAAALAAGVAASLAAQGDFAPALASTVITHVEHDLRVEATAAALYVPPNTVRHRLRRFAE